MKTHVSAAIAATLFAASSMTAFAAAHSALSVAGEDQSVAEGTVTASKVMAGSWSIARAMI